jgi:hypothetical protein
MGVDMMPRRAILEHGSWAASTVLVTIVLAACSRTPEKSEPGARPPTSEEIPERVGVPATTLTYGFSRGRLRESLDLDGFRITKHPITVSEFRACVSAGACAEPPGEGCVAPRPFPIDHEAFRPSTEGHDDLPATCVGTEQARQYCEWIGGALPTLAEWLLAARGREPQRFPWGHRAATCEQHPRARVPGLFGMSPCSTDPPGPGSSRIGLRPEAASPNGLEDVLLTPGELVTYHAGITAGGCQTGKRGCIVFGLEAGAIDAVEPVRKADTESGDGPAREYGFRCVWAEEEVAS